MRWSDFWCAPAGMFSLSAMAPRARAGVNRRPPRDDGRSPDIRSITVAEWREETFRRVDQEEKLFRDFMARLRNKHRKAA